MDNEIEKSRIEMGRIDQKLSDEKFTGRAPAEVVDKERARRDELAGMLTVLESRRTKLE